MAEGRDEMRARQRARDIERVEAFVVRARRIETHSLCRDRERLRALAKATFTLRADQSGTWMVWDLPPEEQVESAAARVRPLLLADVSVPNVLASIKSLSAGAEQHGRIKEWVADARKTWLSRARPSGDDGAYVVLVHDDATGRGDAIDNHALALSWIYGDSVHHDLTHRARGHPFGIEERYVAVVPLVAFLMDEALTILESVRNMQDGGVLPPTPDAWAEEVALTSTHIQRPGRAFLSSSDTAGPTTVTEPLGPEWREIGSRREASPNPLPAIAAPTQDGEFAARASSSDSH